MNEVNHYIFGGGRDFSKPFRALVAGGGTGDAAIMMAQQLADRGTGGTVTYVDLSTASRKVVEERARVRGLTNMEFHTGSLLDLPTMGFAPFDYIDCCGVLHHLESPEEGLKALEAVLAEDGGMGLMVYATLGRNGVYPVQNALRTLVGDEAPGKQVALARKFVDGLPKTNWLLRNPFVGDHKLGDDAAFYDLLLHPRDRSYLVPEVIELLGTAGMELVSFIEPVRYDPAVFIRDPELQKRLKTLTPVEKAAVAENVTGSLKTHLFYVKKQGRADGATARIAPHMIPVLKDGNPPEVLARAFKGKSFKVGFDGEEVMLPLPDHISRIVALFDGNRTLADIQTELSLNWEACRKQVAPVIRFLNGLNILWLRSSRPD
nr:class I SAM-dependent methyltransferase [Sneathiella chinensis]